MSLVTDAKVIHHQQVIPGYYRMTLAAPRVAGLAKPGQFLHVRCGSTNDPLLRRPISIHAVDKYAGEISLLYRVAGRGTALLSERKPGELVSIIGPLGRGFTLPKEQEKVFVVSGGIGIAPLYFLLQELAGQGIYATVFQGSATAKLVLLENEIKELGHSMVLATDDGSKGFRGTVTRLFEEYLQKGNCVIRFGTNENSSVNIGQAGQISNDLMHIYNSKLEEDTRKNAFPDSFIFACGPVAMLKGLSEIAVSQRIPCEVSLEERMGCGVGACLSCACKINTSHEGFAYRRVCVEGPVFESGEVSWE